jgi:DNA repair protein SbcD/Mre11
MPIRKVLHAADIHLDSPMLRLESYPDAPVETIRSATRKALTNLIDLAIQEQVDLVVIAGDLYDGDWNEISTGLHFVSEASRLIRNNIPLVIIRGNHDAANLMTQSLPLPKNPDGSDIMLDHARVDRRIFEKLGIAIHGRSFATRAVIENLSLSYPAPIQGMFNLGMLHTSLTGAEGHDTYSPCTPVQLNDKGYDYWALGHIHDRRECHDPNGTPIVFSGNIQGRNIREVGAKGCVIISISDSQKPTTTFHALDVVRWQVYERDVTGLSKHEELLDSFGEWLPSAIAEAEGRPLAVRVVLKGTSKLSDVLHRRADEVAYDFRSIAIQRSGGQVWLENVKVRTSSPRVIKATSESTAPDDDPLESIRHVVESIRGDETLQESMLESLRPLWRKLPPELVSAVNDPFRLDDPELLSTWLDATEPILVEQMHASEDVA